jgi:hypothetical protein
MTIAGWLSNVLHKSIDVDGYYGPQCGQSPALLGTLLTQRPHTYRARSGRIMPPTMRQHRATSWYGTTPHMGTLLLCSLLTRMCWSALIRIGIPSNVRRW